MSCVDGIFQLSKLHGDLVEQNPDKYANLPGTLVASRCASLARPLQHPAAAILLLHHVLERAACRLSSQQYPLTCTTTLRRKYFLLHHEALAGCFLPALVRAFGLTKRPDSQLTAKPFNRQASFLITKRLALVRATRRMVHAFITCHCGLVVFKRQIPSHTACPPLPRLSTPH